ncbi:hypothetical protein D081_1199 [Anaerovibrio sp. JC8]|uniref:Nif11 family protein n=1 Tax=Anaerovibrio sp. JC8 TaxID=1240085 RepID=UPI000A0BCF3A|nr:Nif11 family protein [Anaerovibrio sp. JC8]ORU00105.1 hypothetical protein D081_1199 [Anaerovibrio sp. JC8]
MAKENVGKFYAKLAQDAALAEKLNALDKDFADTNEGSADDIAFREKAAEAIVLPLAKEAGLPFTLEELKEYEQEQLKNMTLSEDELDQVAGGDWYQYDYNKRNRKGKKGGTAAACAFIGVGVGKVKSGKKTAFCIFVGISNGPIADSN